MTRQLQRRPRRARRGAAAIEFALVMVLGFIPVLFTLIDWSWYFLQATIVQTELWNAARVGVSYDQTVDGVCPDDRAEAWLDDALDRFNISGATISSSVDGSTYYGASPPQQIVQLTLTVTVPFSAIIGLSYTPDTMGGTVTMPFEVQQSC